MSTELDTQMIKKIHNNISFEDMKKQADLLIKSGFLPKAIQKPEQAVAIMMTGRELGMSPMQAFRSIYVVHGQPTLSAQLMLALCENTGELENKRIEQGDNFCQVTLKRKGQDPYMVKFTIEDAKRLFGEAQFKQKDNWERQPQTMLLWRAISAACRVVFPDAVTGLYTPDELGAEIDLTPTGEIVEVRAPEQIEQEPPQPNDAPKTDEIPDDQLANYTLKSGMYKDMTLSQVVGQQTETGKNKGLEYLEWLSSEQAVKVNPKVKEVVKRFLKAMDLA